MKKLKVLKNQSALEILKIYSLPTFDYKKISGAHEVCKFPTVLKIDSPSVVHKAERKGVHVVHHKEHAKKSFNKIRKQSKGFITCNMPKRIIDNLEIINI